MEAGSGDVEGPRAVDLRDYVSFELERAHGRRVFATDVVAIDVVCLEPGQVVEARRFPTSDAIYTVLGGVAWVVTDDAEVTLRALQSVMVPADVAHGLRNDAPDPLILQVVVSPPDEAPHAPPGPAEGSGGEPMEQRAPGERPPGLADRLRRRLGGR